MSKLFAVRYFQDGKWQSWSAPEVKAIDIIIDGDYPIEIGTLIDGKYNFYSIEKKLDSLLPGQSNCVNMLSISIDGDAPEDYNE